MRFNSNVTGQCMALSLRRSFTSNEGLLRQTGIVPCHVPFSNFSLTLSILISLARASFDSVTIRTCTLLVPVGVGLSGAVKVSPLPGRCEMSRSPRAYAPDDVRVTPPSRLGRTPHHPWKRRRAGGRDLSSRASSRWAQVPTHFHVVETRLS